MSTTTIAEANKTILAAAKIDKIKPSETKLSHAMMIGAGKVTPTQDIYLSFTDEEHTGVKACPMGAAAYFMESKLLREIGAGNACSILAKLWPKLRQQSPDQEVRRRLDEEIICRFDVDNQSIEEIATWLAEEGY